MDYLFLVVGLLVLVAGGDWLLKSAVALSLRLRVPKIVIGLTVVSLVALRGWRDWIALKSREIEQHR